MALINKETICAEIERRKIAYRSSDNLQDAIRYDEITDILAFLDSLPEQPVEGLEEEAINYCFDNGINLSPRQATDFARHFAEWGRKQVLQEIYDGKVKPVDKITAAWLDGE